MSARIRLSDGVLQSLAALLGLWLYASSMIALKWWFYPGWTWRGYVTDLKALFGVLMFCAGFALWLFRLYRMKTAAEAGNERIRRTLLYKRLGLVVITLLMATASLSAALLWVGEREIAPALLADAEESNWKHAREDLADLSRQPLRPALIETFKLFVEVHALSERDQLKASRSLREDRLTTLTLIEEGEDYHALNTLTFSELSKGLYFVEDADNPNHWLLEAIEMLRRTSGRLRDRQDQATVIARTGEMYLAGKEYMKARELFQQAARLEARPVALARILADIGNTFAGMGDTTSALRIYAEAEEDYPQGRGSIFYSNFGYVLMLAQQYDAAKMKVERALQIDPEDWYSYLNLGLIKESLGEYDDAAEDFRLVVEKSSNPDSQREARIFAGRCLELAAHDPAEYLRLYLAAEGRSAEPDSVRRLVSSPRALASLYDDMAKSLERTNTHAIEVYIHWFQARAAEVRSGKP